MESANRMVLRTDAGVAFFVFSVEVDILSISIDNRPLQNSGLISYWVGPYK